MSKLHLVSILTLLSILASSSMAPPQVAAKSGPASSILFAKTWNPGSAQSVAVDSSGNVYVAGYSVNSSIIGVPPHYDVLLLKYNSTGNLQWVRTWGGLYDDLGYGVAVDSLGNAYVTGQTASFNSGGSCQAVYNPSAFEPCPDIFLIKFDPSGSLLWQRNLGGNNTDIGEGVAVDASNNIYVAGTTFSLPCISGCPLDHAILLKFNSTGSMLWQRYYGAKTPTSCCVSTPFVGRGVAVDLTSGSIYLVGQYIASHFGVIVKYDSTGAVVWQKAGGDGSVCTDARGITVDPSSGNIYITGLTHVSCFSINSYGLIAKLDPSGNLLWKKRWGSGPAFLEFGLSVAASANGHVYVTGNMQGGGKTLGVSILNFDPSGVLQSRIQWGASPGDEGRGVAVDSAGDALVAGEVSSPPFSSGIGNNTLGTPVFNVSPAGATSDVSMLGLGTPTGAASTPSGTENNGGSFLLNYKPPPSVLLPCSSVVCSILSNSPISNVGYLASNQTLHFTATGDTGTNDTATVIIPKSLVAGQNGANIRVYLNGQRDPGPIGMDANSTDFLVYITLTFHSPVYVSLYLGGSSSGLPVALPLVALLLLVPIMRRRRVN